MRSFLRKCGFWALPLLAAQTLSAQQATPPIRSNPDQLAVPPRVFPLAAKDVLALLPPPPAGWKLTTSMATNQISSWLITIAQRQIESPQPEKPGLTGSTSHPGPPMRTTFMLIDSGYDPSALGVFADFKPSNNGAVEKMLFRNYPTIRTRGSGTSESLQILINTRFLLRIEVENQPKDAVLSWAQQIPYDRYNPPRGTTITSLPTQVSVATVDELNPGNNHESKVTTGKRNAMPR
jgi:hypothetical protein